MTKKHFRALILCYVALLVVSSAAPFVLTGYSQELSDAFENEPTPWLYESLWALLVVGPLLVVAVAGMVGLYLFKRWGRTLSLYSTALGVLILPFSGPSLYGGIDAALGEAGSLLWGAIMALSYYSALAVQFSDGNAVKATRDAATPEQA